MNGLDRSTTEDSLAAAVRRAEDMLDRLRMASIRYPRTGTDDTVQPALDNARGLLNRALARIEELRLTPDDAFAAMHPRAVAAVDQLKAAVADLEALLVHETA